MSTATAARSTVTDHPEPIPTRRRRIRYGIFAERAGLLAIALGAWEYGAGRWFDPFFSSKPSAIAASWWELASSGELWTNALSTFQSAVIGFALGGLLALTIGYALGSSRHLSQLLEPFITAIYSIPKLALIPLFVMWFGTGRELQVVISTLVVFFLMFFNTFYGVRDVSQSLIDAVRVMGGGRRSLALSVRLPSALVWVVAGLKLSVPQGLIAVVVAEILASNKGLGHLVANSAGQYDIAGSFSAIFTLLVIGLIVDRTVSAITRRALRWKEPAR